MKKDIYVLGISESHGASATLLKNGTIIGSYNEERFNKKKNYMGFPSHSIRQLLHDEGITPRKLTLVVLSFKRAIVTSDAKYDQAIGFIYRIQLFLTYHIRILDWIYTTLYDFYLKKINTTLALRHAQWIADSLGIDVSKVTSFPHHITHAASVVYALGLTNKKLTVVTNDGGGDDYCTSVSTYDAHEFHELERTKNRDSFASLYAHMTWFMGMRANEHEYKIMGLAPYANAHTPVIKNTYDILARLHTLNHLTFHARYHERHFQYYLKENIHKVRFDYLASAIQKLTEDRLSQWVTNAIQETGIADVAAAGGIFMNVKANKVISELKVVNNLFVMPSASDESTAIGAAYLGYVHFCKQHNLPINTKPLNNLYLGNKYSNTQIESFIKKHSLHNKYKITKHTDPEMKIAQLLAKGHVVARFAGRMEFGQRALGNRSLLADPSNRDVVRLLNDQIKSRDFWMPFACSILDEDELKYSINPKHLDASSMILSFDTKKEYRHEIQAAIHPYDYTLRPQIVTEKMNKRYYHLIREFKKLTGIGAVLNTSLNLHGEPIVCSLDDGLHTFNDSDLQFLMIEHWLIQKNEKRHIHFRH